MAGNIGVISRAAGSITGPASGLGSGVLSSLEYIRRGVFWPFYMYDSQKPFTVAGVLNTLFWYAVSLPCLALFAPFAAVYSLVYNIGKRIYIGGSEGFIAGIFYPATCFNELSAWYQDGPFGKSDGIYQNRDNPNGKVLVAKDNKPVSYMTAYLFALFMVSSVNREIAAAGDERRIVSTGPAHEFKGISHLLSDDFSSSTAAPQLTVPARPQHQANRPSNTNDTLKTKIASLGEPPHDRKGFQKLDTKQYRSLSREEAKVYHNYQASPCPLSNTPIQFLTDPVTIQWGDDNSNLSVTVGLSALRELAEQDRAAEIDVPGRLVPKNLNDDDVVLCHGFRQLVQPTGTVNTPAKPEQPRPEPRQPAR